MTHRAIVGPESMYVESHGVRSKEVELTDADNPEDVREKARALWRTIRHSVSWVVWVSHRITMAHQRAMTATVEANWPGPYYPGPRPDLIAQKPWKNAIYGEWASLPCGVVSRLLKSSK